MAGPYTLAYKTAVFLTFIFAVFLPQSIAETLLLPLLKNTVILTFYIQFQFWLEYDSALAYQIVCKLDDRRRSYDVILILQDGGIASQIYFRFWFGHVSHLTTSRAIGTPNFGQISYLNPWPRYYYIRFLKTNGRHTEIVLSVSILTLLLSLACDSALAYQILCKLDDRGWRYDVLILKDGGHSVANLLPMSGLATSNI